MSELSRRRRLLVLAICCASIIVVVMDISIVNVALPTMRRDLQASVSGLQWTVDAYTLVLAAFLVLAGSTADRVGRRRTFQVGLAVFGVGSLLCGLAPGIGWLIAARTVQAVGGTMLNPVSMSIIATTFPDPAERARAIGVVGSMSGLSLALGPILGGILVDGTGWRSIFWVNVPIVAAAIVLTALFVPESRATRARRVDLVGQILVIVVLGTVVTAIIESRRLGWTSPVILGLFAVAVLGVLGIIGYESRRVDPLLELRLFRSVPFSAAIVMALCALCGFGAFLFVTTLYLQDVRGLSALAAGLCVVPVGALVVVLSPFTGRFVGARGPRVPLVVAGVALALGGGVSLWLGPVTALPAVLAVCLLFGLFLATVNPPITDTAVSGMPRSMAGVAASLASAGRQTGTTLGVAIAGTIVASAADRDGTAFTAAAHGVWWMVLGLGIGIAALGLLSTSRPALATAARAATLFESLDGTPEPRPAAVAVSVGAGAVDEPEHALPGDVARLGEPVELDRRDVDLDSARLVRESPVAVAARSHGGWGGRRRPDIRWASPGRVRRRRWPGERGIGVRRGDRRGRVAAGGIPGRARIVGRIPPDGASDGASDGVSDGVSDGASGRAAARSGRPLPPSPRPRGPGRPARCAPGRRPRPAPPGVRGTGRTPNRGRPAHPEAVVRR
jgi:EmrB/QacA subfamily drug resistance transporter